MRIRLLSDSASKQVISSRETRVALNHIRTNNVGFDHVLHRLAALVIRLQHLHPRICFG